MIKIGLIGSLSSHSRIIACLLNLPKEDGSYRIEDARVTAICGVDASHEHTKKVADTANIPNIVENIEDLFPLCDAVMVMMRTADMRLKYALPFIEKGYPVFLDKPVLKSYDDLEKLEEIINEKKHIIMGGSCYNHCEIIDGIKEDIENGKYGEIRGATFNYTANINDQYDGIFFYLPHSIDIATKVFGYNPKSVNVSVSNEKNFNVSLNYEDKLITIIINDCQNNGMYFTIYGKEKNESILVDSQDLFEKMAREFVRKIREKEITLIAEPLINPVKVLIATDKSIKEHKECEIF